MPTNGPLPLEAAKALVGSGDHAGGAAEAEAVAVAGLKVDPGPDGYDAAGLVARCVRLAEQDATKPEAERQRLAEQYAGRAVSLLRQAVAGGRTISPGDLEAADVFAPLKDCPAFRQLVADLRRP